jgi:transmembrane sensor
MGQNDKDRRAKLEKEAAGWLIRLESGDADLASFEQWRAGDLARAAAFAHIDAAWSRLDRIRALRPLGLPDPDLFAPPAEAEAEEPPRRWFMKAAAGVVAAAGVGGAGYFILGARAFAETAVGERRAVRLPDGSLLDLNTDTRVSWRFDGGARRAWLDRGEAALEIAADGEKRPFAFSALGATLGLEPGLFNARLRGDEAEILVLRGRATLGAGLAVLQGQAATISAEGAATRVLDAGALTAATAWRNGEFVFDGVTLGRAVAEYNRYLEAKVEIADPSIRDLKLGGVFRTHDLQGFLNSLETVFGLEVTRSPDGGAVVSAKSE